ncbi:acetate kinase [Planktothrix pseudagardhii]|nr:acetate kinase [Planktothrix pseudagardhii]
MKILVLNAGSSSQKSCLYEITKSTLPDYPLHPIWEATIDWTASQEFGLMKVKTLKVKQEYQIDLKSKQDAIAQMFNTLSAGETKVLNHLSEINIVGHRVVHGGSDYSEAILINEKVKETIQSLIPLAPTHNPAHLEGIEAVETLLGTVPQVAVFDTAFHRKMPDYATIYPIPYQYLQAGIKRYGFHGTSHKYCAKQTAKILGKPLEFLKIITCHLGNGCSLAAIQDGISINTTMGFTPLEGLMMGTRSGSIDPSIILYLQGKYQYDVNQINQILNKESGLKGIVGESGDLRYVLAEMKAGNPKAKLAFEMYIHRLKMGIGQMLASLGGLDALVFTAGVGEHAEQVREATCQGWEFLGLKLDLEKNASHPVDEEISTADSKVKILVIHTEEDWAIATECWHLFNYNTVK